MLTRVKIEIVAGVLPLALVSHHNYYVQRMVGWRQQLRAASCLLNGPLQSETAEHSSTVCTTITCYRNRLAYMDLHESCLQNLRVSSHLHCVVASSLSRYSERAQATERAPLPSL